MAPSNNSFFFCLKQLLIVFFIGMTIDTFAQPINDACSNAIFLCPQKTITANNIGATQTSYPFGEDDFNFCFIPKKTIWFKLETNNKGGKALIDLTNVNFSTPIAQGINMILAKAGAPCDGTTYAQDTCITGIVGNSVITVDSLDSNTTYYLCLAGEDVGGTISEFSLQIKISGKSIDREIPSLAIWSDKTILCEGESVTLATNLTDCPNPGKYRWFKNGQLFAISDSTYISTTGLQNGDVISVQNNCFLYCIDTITAYTSSFTVKQVSIQVSNDTTIFAGDRALLECYSLVDSIFWEPSYLMQNDTATISYADPKTTTTFYANAYVDGCLVTKSITVSIVEDLKIYNTFSPNDDGINETWVIEGIEKYPDAEISIFSRWGQRVFFMLGYNRTKAWDGTQNGRKLAAGTYFYTIDLNNGDSKVIKGSINLIR